jgi:predicted dehydrogenase
MYEDIASAMMEYRDKTVTLDMTAWEPTEWCNEWAIDVYGTNGSLHAVPDFPVAGLYLREARGGFDAGTTKMKTEFAHGTSNVATCFRKQFESLFSRVRGVKELELKEGCCGLEKSVMIFKIIAAAYKSSSSRQWVDVEP